MIPATARLLSAARLADACALLGNGAVARSDSSRDLQLTEIDAKTCGVIARVTGLVSPISPNPAPFPDGERAWQVHKNAGEVEVAEAQASAKRGSLDAGPIRSHANPLASADRACVGISGSAREVRERVGVDSTDVEAKGQVAGQRNLVEFGAAALRRVISDSKAYADGKDQADPMPKLFDSRLRRAPVAAAS